VPDGGTALLSPAQVAQLAGLSVRAIYRAIERGDLPASRLCSRLRVRQADVEGWLARNRVRIAPTAKVERFSPEPSAKGLRLMLRGPA
jgi:excisionase family DNA binding protein